MLAEKPEDAFSELGNRKEEGDDNEASKSSGNYASDASDSFGFGVCSVCLPRDVVRDAASHVCGHSFRLRSPASLADPQVRTIYSVLTSISHSSTSSGNLFVATGLRRLSLRAEK